MNIHIQGVEVMLFDQLGQPTLQRRDLFIKDGIIAAIGDKPADFCAQRVIDGTHRLAIPGLINCHTHAYMTLMRNSADDLSFNDWLFGNITPMEDTLVGEDGYWGTLLGCMEMLRTGTTCFLDMHMFPGQVTRAVRKSGMRAAISRGLVGSGNDEGGARRLREALDEMEEAKDDPRLTFLLAPHAIYTCDESYLQQIVSVAKEKNMRLHIHVSESRTEIENAMQKHGCSPVELLARLGVFDIPTVAAHCVHLSDEDIRILAEKRVSVATNPISNCKLANGFAPVPKLLQNGINVCIGTDGAASNNTLNLFREMSFVSLLHKGAEEDPLVVSAADTLKMATVSGARALGLDAMIGSIEVGKRADIVLLDTDCPQMNPHNKLINALVYSANGSEVDTVLVDGEIVLEHRAFPHIDEERVRYEVTQVTKKFGKQEN